MSFVFFFFVGFIMFKLFFFFFCEGIEGRECLFGDRLFCCFWSFLGLSCVVVVDFWVFWVCGFSLRLFF